VPLWITAPAANIAGPVIPVGADARGAMQAPEGANDDPIWTKAFWWRYGVMPGQTGSAVIGGHLDRKDGSPALFWGLGQMAPGDSLWIQTALGTRLHFIVTEVKTFTNPTSGVTDSIMQRIFGPAKTANLNLITCAGDWTGTEYNQKLVVFTTLVP
jgi:sortase (surface protein transpeptidase)